MKSVKKSIHKFTIKKTLINIVNENSIFQKFKEYICCDFKSIIAMLQLKNLPKLFCMC